MDLLRNGAATSAISTRFSSIFFIVTNRFAEWKDKHAWEYDYREQRKHTTSELMEEFKKEKI